MNLFGLIAATGLPTWVTTSFPIIKGILVGYIALAAIAIIVLVLLQPSNSQGMTGITGETTELTSVKYLYLTSVSIVT